MTAPTPIEGFVPLSQSRVWDMQRRYYESKGQRAWQSHEVPHYITGNALIANAYAQVFAAFIEDALALGPEHPIGRIDRDRPIDVVELGSGAGRNGFLLARALDEQSRGRDLPRFRVILTDFTERNVRAFAQRPELVRLAQAGLVDFAIFDADDPQPLELLHSGETLGPDPADNPLLVVANYVFDTLRQDAFDIRDGRLMELTFRAAMPDGTSADAPNASALVHVDRTAIPAALPRYDDPLLDGLLSRYLQALRRAEVLLPVGGIAALRFLFGLRGGRGCLISGDKGYRRTADLDRRGIGELTRHGSFSFMVNYDALGALAEQHAGSALTVRARHSRFTVAALSFLGGEPARLPRFQHAFNERIDRFGPAEYHRLYKAVRDQDPPPDLPTLLVLLMLSDYDPVLFARFGARIVEQLPQADADLRHELGIVIDEVIERTYPVGPQDDALFLAARLLFKLDRFAESSLLFERVTREQPARRAGWYNYGICLEAQRDVPGATAAYRRALELDPTYGRAADALARLNAGTG